MNDNLYVWVFHGDNGNFSSAVFDGKDKADFWIKENKVSGTLTKYPINISIYDWAIKEGYFVPKKVHQFSNKFKQNFSSAYQEHYHYVEGQED